MLCSKSILIRTLCRAAYCSHLVSAFSARAPHCAAPPLGLGSSACFAKEARPEVQLCRRTGGGSTTEVRGRGAKPQRETGRTEHGVGLGLIAPSVWSAGSPSVERGLLEAVDGVPLTGRP